MTPTQIIVLLIVLSVVPTTITAYNCTGATQDICAAPSDTCQYYTWTNGTCVPPTKCPS